MNELLAKFRAQHPEYADMSDGELARALHAKFYSDMSFGEFGKQIGLLENTGPTKQPPFPSLPPKVGGALDALVALGVGAGAGLPLLSADTRKYMGELMGRAPGATMAASAAGALATGGAGALATAAKLPTVPALLARLSGSQFQPITQAGQSLAARAAPALKGLSGPLARWIGAGAAGGAAAEAIRRARGFLP